MASTIAAIATPLGNGAISIVKICGNDALKIASALFKPKNLDFFDAEPLRLYLGTFKYKNFCDLCMAVYFKSPHSFTGEDIVEFQCHGGYTIARKVLEACLDKGCSLADKGEFSKRAFLNGKISLSDAEGIVDMINAESDAQVMAGYKLLSGEFSKEINIIFDELSLAVATLEASLDYPEEMEDEAVLDGARVIDKEMKKVSEILKTAELGVLIKNGINIAIVGLPNSGKSSLLNCLLKKERAIVTDIAGTTRDTIEERFFIKEFLVNLIDTAGIRETCDAVEKIGVEKSKEAIKQADIVLIVIDLEKRSEDEKKLIEECGNKKKLFIYNKTDKMKDKEVLYKKSEKDSLYISVKERKNIEELTKKIKAQINVKNIDTTGIVVTNQRHKEALKSSLEAMLKAREEIGKKPTECVLVELKEALKCIGSITGKDASEKVIEKIFSTFCLGK